VRYIPGATSSMRSSHDPSDAGTHGRIEELLASLEARLHIYADGIEHWKEPLPHFCGVPRRWPLDDPDARTVGEALLARYAGYAWSVVEHFLEENSTLHRSIANGRMTEAQEQRFVQCCRQFDKVRPAAILLGIAYDWRLHAVAPALVEMYPEHPAVVFYRQRADSPPSTTARSQ